MHVLKPRYVTALVIICGCAFAAAKGWDIVRFSIANNSPRGQEVEVLQPWFASSGLAFYARRAALTPVQADDLDLVPQRTGELVELLSVRPLSSEYWLSLLRMRRAAGEAPEKVSAALAMSAMTGANEGFVMPRRALFGLSLWETLSPELRMRAALDVVAAPLSGTRRADIQETLREKPEKTRQEIKAALIEQGISAERLREVGLAAESQPPRQ